MDSNEPIYDLILIQPPLLKFLNTEENMDEGRKIEFEYWDSMEKNAGKLLGDLPTEASYGILSIASYLKSIGYKVKILDFHLMDFFKRKYEFTNLTQKDIVTELSKYQSNFYGISVLTISDNWANIITDHIRKFNNDSCIFWGGYYPSNNDISILRKNKNIDLIVRNEGELIIKDLLDNFTLQNLKFEEISGLTYRKDNEILRTSPREIIDNLDILPFLDYSFYDDKYQDLIVPRVYTSRGCKNACYYCTADNSSHRKIRKRSAKIVVDEIENIIKKYHKNFFVMGDLEFLFDLNHSKEICEEIIRRNLDVKWWCQVYPPNIQDDIVKLMKEAGNIQIALGIESTNENALKEVNKKMNSNITLNACKIIKKYDIQIQAYVMIGLPEDTIDSSMNTIKFVGNLIEENLIDVTHFSIMVAYPGSLLFEKSEIFNMKILDKDPNNYFMNCDFLGSGIPCYETYNMSNLEIYSLWLFALAHCRKLFLKNTNFKTKYFNLYEDLGLNNISILDTYRALT